MHEVKLPELGENIEKVTVGNVLVSVGDTVEKDQPLLEVETEKASLEVPSPVAGTIEELKVESGSEAKVGDVVAVIDESSDGEEGEGDSREDRGDEGDATDGEPETPEEDEASGKDAEVDTEGGGDETPEKPERRDAPERSTRERDAESDAPSWPGTLASPEEPVRTPELGNPPPAAPSVRRVARELGVNIRSVRGSGPGGRIVMDDLKRHVRDVVSGDTSHGGAVAAASAPALPDFSSFGDVEREPLSALRRAAASNLARAWATVPHVTQHDEADVTELEEARRRFRKRAESKGVKLTVTAIAVKALATAARVFPSFNASIDPEANELVLKKYVHVGVAVDTPRGLMVPVVRDADRKSVFTIASEIADLAERARERKITPDALSGASITVSNLGGLGTTAFSPIVNWPEVAILGLGRAATKPVWRDDGFEPREVLPLSVSYDHRAVDGADAARFLRFIAEALEQPLLLVLEG